MRGCSWLRDTRLIVTLVLQVFIICFSLILQLLVGSTQPALLSDTAT